MNETLKYIAVEEMGSCYRLVAQIDRGGASVTVGKGDPYVMVVAALRWLADEIEHGAKARELTEIDSDGGMANPVSDNPQQPPNTKGM